jgi:hypothetical protein
MNAVVVGTETDCFASSFLLATPRNDMVFGKNSVSNNNTESSNIKGRDIYSLPFFIPGFCQQSPV